MLDVKIDEKQVLKYCLEKIEEKLKEVDSQLVFWDTGELKRRTCMSWNTIQKEFFYVRGFPKYKIGGKWYFPAKETHDFLLNWLKNQKGIG